MPPGVDLCPELCDQFWHRISEVVLFGGIVFQILETYRVGLEKFDHLPLAFAEAGRREATPRVGFASWDFKFEAASFEIERVVTEDTAHLDFAPGYKVGDVDTVNGLGGGKFGACKCGEGRQEVDTGDRGIAGCSCFDGSGPAHRCGNSGAGFEKRAFLAT